jgi:NitT/TauT family transport system permease protein
MSVPSQSVDTAAPAQPAPTPSPAMPAQPALSKPAPEPAHSLAAPPQSKAASLRAIIRRHYLAGTLSVAGGLALWELISRVLVANSLFLAAPSQIAVAIFNLARTGQLWHHISVSSAEFALGYVIACAIGIALGLAMAASVTMKQALQPWVSGLYATPTIALAPLFILWFGIGIWSKVLVVITLVLFPVAINTEAGLRTTSERLIEMLRSFGDTRRQIFLKVSLPSAVPFILAGLKLGIGRGLIGVVVAELFGSRAGLGNLISQSADAFNMPELFAGVVVLALAGIIMTAGFGWLEQRIVPWTRD